MPRLQRRDLASDAGAERGILAGVLLDPSQLDKASTVVSRADFHEPANGQLWDALAVLHDAGKPIGDVRVLVPELRRLGVSESVWSPADLGKLFAEQLAGRMANRGAAVKELKLREQLFIKRSTGALLLSDEVRDLSRTHRTQAVVVGTYASSGKVLYISLKLVRPEGNIVIAAHDYALPMDSNIGGLLY